MGLFSWLFGPPSKDRFAKCVMECIYKAGESRRIVYDRERFSLSCEGDAAMVIFLTNLYDDYCRAKKADRERLLQVVVSTWFCRSWELPEAFEDVQPDLLPVIRSRTRHELHAIEAELREAHPATPYVLLGDHLALSLVYDLKDAMQMIVQADLEKWGVSLYEALEAARENLAGLPMAFAKPSEGPGIYFSTVQDNYDASRLLLLDAVRKLEVKGDHVAMIPNRDTLIITGTEDQDGLAMMAQMVKKFLEDPRPISGSALRLDGDQWVSWAPAPDHPLFRQFRSLQTRTLAQTQ